MRTTIDIDDPILKEVKQLSAGSLFGCAIEPASEIKGARIDLDQSSGSQRRAAMATAATGPVGLASFGLVMYIDHVFINIQVFQWLCK